jgi:predicted nucleic acid-binding protein
LDTGVLITRSRIAADTLPGSAAISAVTLGELSIGVHAVSGNNPAAVIERARRTMLLQQVEHEFDPIPFGPQEARAYGTLGAAILAAGRKTRGRSLDLMIAATAVTWGLPLYTTNPGDFRSLQDLVDVRPVTVAD